MYLQRQSIRSFNESTANARSARRRLADSAHPNSMAGSSDTPLVCGCAGLLAHVQPGPAFPAPCERGTQPVLAISAAPPCEPVTVGDPAWTCAPRASPPIWTAGGYPAMTIGHVDLVILAPTIRQAGNS
jgi:hypothetical protein